MRKTARLLFCTSVAVTGVMLAGCASDTNTTTGQGTSAAGGGSGDIVIGSVNSLSGIATFPESSQAAKAVFDDFNAKGGLNGRKISYIAQDDKVDPASASQAARDLVGSRGAVALVGGASLIECEVNAKYYQEQGIASVPGVGIDPSCFSTPNIAPVNPGPYIDAELSITYGSQTLGLTKMCAFLATAGSSGPLYQKAIANWEKRSGQKMVYVDDNVPNGNPDFTPQAVAAKTHGCEGIFVNMPEGDDLGFLKAAAAQGMTNVTWLFLTSAYTEAFAKSATAAGIGKGVYVPAEFRPFTDKADPDNKAWIDLMTKNNIPLTSFAQAGYVAATNFLDVLKTVDGDVTRASVLKALQGMDPIDNPMVGTAYVFGPDNAHNPATAGWPVKLSNGAWVKAGDDWVTLG